MGPTCVPFSHKPATPTPPIMIVISSYPQASRAPPTSFLLERCSANMCRLITSLIRAGYWFQRGPYLAWFAPGEAANNRVRTGARGPEAFDLRGRGDYCQRADSDADDEEEKNETESDPGRTGGSKESQPDILRLLCSDSSTSSSDSELSSPVGSERARRAAKVDERPNKNKQYG